MLRIIFLTFKSINVLFAERKLTWKCSTTAKAVSFIKWIKLINKKKFVKIILDEDFKTFIIYIVALEILLAGITIYLL